MAHQDKTWTLQTRSTTMTNSKQNIQAATETLTATQAFVLNAAADHAQGRVERFPDTVKGGARAKVLSGLQARGWIKQSGQHWKICKAGWAAIGRTPGLAEQNEVESTSTTSANPTKASKAKKITTPRAPSKQDQILALLQAEGGVSLVELISATGWQQHSLRGCLSTLNKAHGGTIQSAKRDGQRVYWIDATSVASAPGDTNEGNGTNDGIAA
jgi:hypothetical protein